MSSNAKLWNHGLSFVQSMSLKCAIELGIPETMDKHGKPITATELASALSIPDSKTFALSTLMNLLSSSGVFTAVTTKDNSMESYTLNTVSKLLTRNDSLYASPYILMMLSSVVVNPSVYFAACLKALEAATPFSLVHGVGLWDEAEVSSEFNVFFNEAMASDARFARNVVVGTEIGVELFGGLNSLVDVGGGTGTMAKAIAKAFPGIKCCVLDLHHVVDTVEDWEGVEFIGGDMFKYVPAANAVLLKWILHDWNDDDCVTILQRCKDAIPAKKDGGKIVIIDMVVGITSDVNIRIESQLFYDLEMLLLLPGKERNENEWKKLFQAAGFSDYKIMPYLGLRSIIEVYK